MNTSETASGLSPFDHVLERLFGSEPTDDPNLAANRAYVQSIFDDRDCTFEKLPVWAGDDKDLQYANYV